MKIFACYSRGINSMSRASRMRLRSVCLLQRSHSTKYSRSQGRVPCDICLWPRERTFASLCSLASLAVSTDQQRAHLYTLDLVCRHCLSVSASPKHYTQIAQALGHGLGCRTDEIGVVNGFFGESAKILGLVAFFQQGKN